MVSQEVKTRVPVEHKEKKRDLIRSKNVPNAKRIRTRERKIAVVRKNYQHLLNYQIGKAILFARAFYRKAGTAILYEEKRITALYS